MNLDHNLLMHLALGYECRIYDFGSRGNFWEYDDGSTEQLWVPRALWWGVEWSRYALETLWHLEPEPPLLRGYNVQALFDEKLKLIPKPLFKKLKYYRAHLAEDMDAVRLRGYYTGTELDGQKDAYRDFMRAHAARGAGGAAPEEGSPEEHQPSPEGLGMRIYDAQTMRRVGMTGKGPVRAKE